MNGQVVAPRGRRVRARALQTSAMSVAMVLGGQAFAQCAPEPTTINGTTSCSGIDSDGLRVTTYGTQVTVQPSATVRGAGGAAISVQVPSDTSFGAPVGLTVAGLVDGGTGSGVAALWQPAATGFGYTNLTLGLTVLDGGVVTGVNGVVAGRTGPGAGNTYVTIDNAGTIAGTSGIALLSTARDYAGFSSIINRRGGSIGAISGPVGRLDNAGTIDGGTRSAIDWGTGYSPFFGAVGNSGTIVSTSSAATLANVPSGRTLTNSGAIVNGGAGEAITGDQLNVVNAATGRIATSGTTAIRAGTFLQLTNAGTIEGNVLAAASPSYVTGSTVDSSAGQIRGSLTFGSGNDTLVATYNGTGLTTGVTGTIDGGAGIDTVRVRFATDATVATALTLPTSFEQITLAPDARTTATLADGFGVPGTLQIAGAGTIVNRTTLSGVSASSYDGNGAPTFLNAGRIATSGGMIGTYAVVMNTAARFENSGTISATNGGVNFSAQGSFSNSGTITAVENGVSLFGPSFANTGTIRSTAGTGVILSGSSGSNWTNSGLIEGIVAGAQISSNFVNTGTIASGRTGVILGAYGVLQNRAGGVINGGTAAIGPQTSGSYVFNATIANAGTINGNVAMTGQSFSNAGNGNQFFALAGGVLNGNLSLGQNDTLITEFSNNGPGIFAGITGTVSGTGATLRYRVRTDVTTVLGTAASFARVGYDLFDDASLTLTASTPQTQQLLLGGRGTVDLTADLSAATQPAISTTGIMSAPGETVTATALSITSRGTVSLDRQGTGAYAYAAVVLGGSDDFTNAGIINVRDRNPNQFSTIYAVANGNTVTNSGTIMLDGAMGVQSARRFINSGSITQAVGGGVAAGVRDVGIIDNAGTISVAGIAVQYVNTYGGTLTNSGTIASGTDRAIQSNSALTITNLAGGTISAAANRLAVVMAGGTTRNAGTINGSIDLGYSSFGGRTYLPGTYIAAGGTLNGSLTFGAGSDFFLQTGAATGVTRTINGGDGFDVFGYSRTASGAVTLGTRPAINFEADYVEAIGADTSITLIAPGRIAESVYIGGDGTIINEANIDGAAIGGLPVYSETPSRNGLNGFVNRAEILGGVRSLITSLSNFGTIGSAAIEGDAAISQYSSGTLTFDNSGRVVTAGMDTTVELSADMLTSLTATNSGTIEGGMGIFATFADQEIPGSIDIANSGSITASGNALSVGVGDRFDPLYPDGAGAIRITNSGTILSSGDARAAVDLSTLGASTVDYAITNSGLIRSTGSGITETYADWWWPTYSSTKTAYGVHVTGRENLSGRIVNAASGIIETTGEKATAIGVTYGGALDLENAGTIRGGAGAVLTDDEAATSEFAQSYIAGAIQTIGQYDDRIVNTGTIIGSIDLGAGNDRIENAGRLEGNIFLGDGDDTFLQHASATLIGTVDGGNGTDSLIVDATGGGAVNGDQFINFERFSQIGAGNVTYSGSFRFDTIGLSGGSVTVGTGETLSSAGAVTIAGGSTEETVLNNGIIAGSIDLAGGNDRIVNNGAVAGSVALGGGDDRFVEGIGSTVAGGVDGGAGDDLYTVLLAGNRSGIGQRTNFERLAIEGSGVLSLALDQRFDAISLAGTGLNLSLGTHGVGRVTGSDGDETVAIDGDVGAVSLGAGNDTLTLGTVRAAGLYSGGVGNDALRFTATTPVILAGTATGFEQVSLTGGALTVTGTLGTAATPLAFGDGNQQLTVAAGGTLAGVIDLGAGNDGFRLASGGVVAGSVSGGAGTDTATLELAVDRTLAGDLLRDFEVLATEGRGTLSLTGTHGYDRLVASGDVTVGTGAVLGARQVEFGAGDQRLTIIGGFAGSVDGGAGNDRIAVSGGTAASPVAFGTVANIETFGMTGGYATIAGSGALGSVDMSGGRLVGLMGSTITASQITVRPGATFGSAGTVVGNVTVAGTLSPGASPGTMTVTGNVALAGGSVSLFELTPGVSDRLVVTGNVSIASGATLEIVSAQGIRPGSSFDLIVANGGITGSYTTIVKPSSLFGFVVQRGDRIQLLGQFLGNPLFDPQVARSIDYANTAIVAQPATSALFAALPSLLTASGASNPQAFAQLTPEPYASAIQVGVENALTLTDVARGAAFGTDREEAGGFTFAQTVGNWRTLGADAVRGTAQARTSGYGFLGGLGFGNRDWSVGAFGGYLDNRQRIDALGARTKANGFVAGLHGRYLLDGFGLTATILYDGGDARTERTLPGASRATAQYDLHGWVSDLSASYGFDTASGWSLRPKVGVTYVRTTRGRATELGGPFALTVARDRHVAGFADGGITFGRSEASEAPFRPFVGLGVRYQIEGRRADALAGYAGAPLGLIAMGASRASVVGTASGGVTYRFADGLDLFSQVAAQTGVDDHQESIGTGLRLRF